jgi:hypothetical protein
MKLEEQRPQANAAVTAYGRGTNALAFVSGSGVSIHSQLDGPTYQLFGPGSATIAGGDSGGPSYIEDWDDPLSINRKLEYRLVGVHSFSSLACVTTFCDSICNPTATCVWNWVSAVSNSTDAAVFPLRSAILATIQALPPDDGFVGTFGNTPDTVLHHKRALYALSIDEPLIAPPGAATDVQLTFARCHNVRFGQDGCPVTPDLQQWGYDDSSHRLMHAASVDFH